MFRTPTILAATVVVLFIQGCAQFTHLTRTRSLPSDGNKGEAILIDAKQRAILAVHATTDVNGSDIRVCAEPSPDALSALATSSGLSLSKSDALKLASNLSLAEGAGSIGLRTQSITLMRDAMYRLCEGYLSGALDGPAYETLLRRFQSSMVAILAIEQLTGVVRAPALVLGGNATAGNAELAADLTAKTESALQNLRSGEKTLATKQGASKAAEEARAALESEKSSLEKKKSDGTALTPDETTRLSKLSDLIATAKTTENETASAAKDAEKDKNDKQALYDSVDSARQAALSGGGSSAVKVSAIPTQGRDLSTGDVSAISTAVKDIVSSTLELNFGRELCTTVLLKSPPANLTGSVYAKCVDYLNETVEELKQDRVTKNYLTPTVKGLLEATTTLLLSSNGTSADKLKAASDALSVANKVYTPDPNTGTQLLRKPGIQLTE